MPDAPDPFDALNARNIRLAMQRIQKAYDAAIVEITLAATGISYNGERLNLDDYPVLLQRIKAAIRKLHPTVFAAIVNSIEIGWGISNLKNNLLVDKRLAGRIPSARAKAVLYDPNKGALTSFLQRADNGLNLSDRVWRNLAPLQAEMEAGLAAGISEGKSAAQMASTMKRYLNEPDKLFRRVRDSNGKLQLSKAAEAYKPGQGVYRSSYKNAKRLTITETNGAYRRADVERWQKIPFIVGYRIVLSNNHPVYDICDELNKSIYPKDFVWSGWHPHCRCHMESVQISDAEFERYEDAILGFGEAPAIDVVEETPAVFNRWMENNSERIQGWKSVPHFISENPKYTAPLLQQ